jgi:hypothetical protein
MVDIFDPEHRNERFLVVKIELAHEGKVLEQQQQQEPK